MRSEQLSAAILPNLTTRLLMYTTFPYDCENPSHVAQKASEWPFLVITGGKKWKAIKTSEGNDFLKVTQRRGTEWELRSELIRSDYFGHYYKCHHRHHSVLFNRDTPDGLSFGHPPLSYMPELGGT